MSVDGCNGNTGWKDGAVSHIEQLVGRPLQWLVCVFHLAELVFRKFFIAVGKSSISILLLSKSYIAPKTTQPLEIPQGHKKITSLNLTQLWKT